MRKRNQFWTEDFRARLRFEGAAIRVHPDLRRREHGRGWGSRVVYSVRVALPEYEKRQVEMQFRRTAKEPAVTRIYADGPTESPHRYAAHPSDSQSRSSLCIWHYDDPPEMRWVAADGLLALINHTRIHLFKEAYWRETGEWPGPEAPHATRGSKEC